MQNILENSFAKLRVGACHVAISNGTDAAIIYLHNNVSSNVLVYTDDNVYKFPLRHFELRNDLFPSSSRIGVLLFDENHKQYRVSDNINFYQQFVFYFLKEVYQFLKSVFYYIYQHLTERQYHNQSLIDIEQVRMRCANIICEFELVDLMLTNNELNMLSLIAYKLQNLMHDLIKLGGARNSLDGNLMRFAHEFALVKKMIIND